MKNKAIKNVIVFVGILLIFIILYVVINRVVNKEHVEDNTIYLKDYQVNEYIPMYVDDESMAEIYLKDYIHTMYTNVEKAYNLLDEEYRNIKFGSLENYKNYVNLLGYNNYTVSKYYTTTSEGYIIFGVYDTNDNLFIFKTKGVMQYSVYLDDYTVEI